MSDGVALLPPRANPRLIGHEAAEAAMLDAWNAGRTAQSWLICGPRGIGKATLAYRFARFVLAQGGEGGGTGGLFGEAPKPTSLHVPEESPTFHRIVAGSHLDLLCLERALNEKTGKLKAEIAVDDVREVGAFLHRSSAEGGWRVVVVDSADDMGRSAANAILKLLEEPPARALMLLVSHNPGGLLPTIRSRCRRLVLQPLPDATVARLLSEHRPDIAPADAAALAGLAEGSVGMALRLAQEGGLDLYRELIGLFGTLPRTDIAALQAFGDRLARAEAEEAYRTVTELLGWWVARLVRAMGQGALPPPVVPEEEAVLRRLSAAGGLDRWVAVWEKITHLFSRADSANLDRKQVVLNAFAALETAVRA